MAVTTGGKLAEAARADGVPVIPLPAALQPRAAVAYMFAVTAEPREFSVAVLRCLMSPRAALVKSGAPIPRSAVETKKRTPSCMTLMRMARTSSFSKMTNCSP